MQHRRQAHLALAAVVSALGASAALLFNFPPETNGFYPQCPFHALTGLLCPGCGATRALAALTHGHFVDAVHLNGLIILLLPLLALYGAIEYERAVTGTGAPWPRISNKMVFALLVATMVFGVARNLYAG